MSLQIPKESLLIDWSIDKAVPFLPTQLTATLKTGITYFGLVIEPHGTITFIVDGQKFTTAPVRGKATIYVPLNVGPHAFSVQYSGDQNYAASVSDGKLGDIVDFHVSLDQSWMTVTPALNGRGYDIEVQLNDAAGNPIKISSIYETLIRLTSSEGLPDVIRSFGNGRYTSFLAVKKAAPETLTVTAWINGVA